VAVMNEISAQLANYEKELEEMKLMTKQEFVASLRRFGYSLAYYKHYQLRKHVASFVAFSSSLVDPNDQNLYLT
jgi:hypothetical protein